MAQSDVVRIALNLAYLPEDEVKGIRLDKEGFVSSESVRLKNKIADSQIV